MDPLKSEQVDALTREIEALIDLKNSAGYLLLYRDLSEGKKQIQKAFGSVDPGSAGSVGGLQGALKAYGVILGDEDNVPLIEEMISTRREELERLQAQPLRVNREAFMRS